VWESIPLLRQLSLFHKFGAGCEATFEAQTGWSFQMRYLEPHSKHVSRTDHPVRANFGGLRHHSF